MPLRDPFHPPLDNRRSWDELHGAWPTVIVMALSRQLPPRYVAGPYIHLGGDFETAVVSFEGEEPDGLPSVGGTDLPDQDEYEVRVYDTKRHRRLVAAIEIVSPANKDRPEHRHVFVAKCAELVRQHVSVVIVDMVTSRQFNLYSELLEQIGHNDPSLTPEAPSLYAVACRGRRDGNTARLEIWAHALTIGQPLPTLPLWLADNLAVPLELEASYEETCRILRIP
jgi:hypothetical protein